VCVCVCVGVPADLMFDGTWHNCVCVCVCVCVCLLNIPHMRRGRGMHRKMSHLSRLTYKRFNVSQT
jgi:hypothetical protein